MTKLAAVDWLFFLRRRHWPMMTVGADVPVETAEALASVAPAPTATGKGDGHGPHLMVLGPGDLAGATERMERHAGDEGRCTVLLPGRGGGSSATLRGRPATPPPTLVLRRAHLDPGRWAYYASDLRAGRLYAWRVLGAPHSLKGRAARAGLGAFGRGLVTFLREEDVVLWCPPEALHPDAGRTLLLSAGKTDSNPAIAYVFASDDARPGDRPTHIVKLPRVRTRAGTVRREQSGIARMAALLPGGPVQARGPVRWGEDTVGWAQAALAGSQLDRAPFADRLDAARRLAAWSLTVEEAAERAIAAGRLRPPDTARWAASLAAAAGRMLPLTPSERAHLHGLPERAAAAGLTLTFTHQDAGPWNILVWQGHPALVDWESAGWGLPGGDTLYLFLYLLFNDRAARTPAERVHAFRTAFLDPEGRPDWLAEVLARWVRRHRLAPTDVPDLFGLFLLRIAVRQACLRLSARGKQAADDPFFELWRACVSAGAAPWRGSCGGPA